MNYKKLFGPKIGIDLGTVNCLVINEEKQILLNEPSVVAKVKDSDEVLAVGFEALDMVGKTPENIEAIRPLFNGAIANYTITEQMLEIFITKALGRVRFIKPDVAVSIPVGSTNVEYQAVFDALKTAGAKNSYLVPEPLAAAIGMELPVFAPSGNMVVNIGGGTTEVAVVSLGGLVSFASVRTAGNSLDEYISNYVRKNHSLIIGPRASEQIKIKIGSATKLAETKQKKVEVRGRDVASGMPKNVVISTNEVVEAIQVPLKEMVKGIGQVLETTSPELSSDILDKGMVLSGGTALLPNLDDYITEKTGIPAVVAEDPLFCVIKGIGEILGDVKYFERSLIK
jgi:rod shape-determining protein MreB